MLKILENLMRWGKCFEAIDPTKCQALGVCGVHCTEESFPAASGSNLTTPEIFQMTFRALVL